MRLPFLSVAYLPFPPALNQMMWLVSTPVSLNWHSMLRPKPSSTMAVRTVRSQAEAIGHAFRHVDLAAAMPDPTGAGPLEGDVPWIEANHHLTQGHPIPPALVRGFNVELRHDVFFLPHVCGLCMVLCDEGSGILRMPEPGGVYKEPPEVSNRAPEIGRRCNRRGASRSRGPVAERREPRVTPCNYLR